MTQKELSLAVAYLETKNRSTISFDLWSWPHQIVTLLS